MKLYAISDLHVGYSANKRAVEALREHPDDWIILGGDLGETEEHLSFALRAFTQRFARVLWVPGNHELWAVSSERELLGQARYLRAVELCREHGVLTPEDPYPEWPGRDPATEPEPVTLAPLFTLYDYSFRPDDVPAERALEWAAETGLRCADEDLLLCDPFPDKPAWCAARCAYSEARLAAIPRSHRTVLIDHFPLRQELAVLPAIPRFTIWCGTRRTQDWHTRFRAKVVVYGHLHIRSTRHIHGVRFEEVSLGYPRHWQQGRTLDSYLRQILPLPQAPDSQEELRGFRR
jgi:3',5'-cyclic AMP phosphodiesterase CpdA